MTRDNESFRLPVLGLVLAMLLWGSSFIAMKIALSAYDPLLVILGRMLIAALVFLPFRKRMGKVVYRSGDWKALIFMALCEPCLYFAFEAHALRLTSASQAGMITALLPLLTALSARIVLSERIPRNTLIGFIVALTGVAGLSFSGRPTESSPHPLLGNCLELMAMVCATGYTVTSRYLSARYSALFITAVQSMVGSIFFAPALFLPSTSLPTEINWNSLLSIVYLGAAVSVIAYFLYNHALSRIPASQVTPYVNLIPVFSLMLGWLVLGEQLTLFQYFCATLVLGGTIATQCSFQFGQGARTGVDKRMSAALVK